MNSYHYGFDLTSLLGGIKLDCILRKSQPLFDFLLTIKKDSRPYEFSLPDTQIL